MADRLIFIVPSGGNGLLQIIEDHIRDWNQWFPLHYAQPLHTDRESGSTAQSQSQSQSQSTKIEIPSSNTRDSNATTATATSAKDDRSSLGGGGGMASHSNISIPIMNVLQNQISPTKTKDKFVSAVNNTGTGTGTGKTDGAGMGVLPMDGGTTRGTGAVSVSDDEENPFECQCYEALLSTVIALQTREFESLSEEFNFILSYLRHRDIMSMEVQERIRILKNR